MSAVPIGKKKFGPNSAGSPQQRRELPGQVVLVLQGGSALGAFEPGRNFANLRTITQGISGFFRSKQLR